MFLYAGLYYRVMNPMSTPAATDNAPSRPLTRKEKQALKHYEEYKKLRKVIGRPVRAFDDIEGILKDLQGEGFSQLEEAIEQVKRSKAKTDSQPSNEHPHAR